MSLEYIRKAYGVPADLHRRVVCSGEPGIIVGSSGPHLRVVLDKHRPSLSHCYHPTYEVVYGEIGAPRPLTRSQLNYQRWLDADCGYSFAEWMGFGRQQSVRP